MRALALLLLAVTITACASASQNTYDAAEVGKAKPVTFATVLGSRVVNIKGENSGLGLLGGGAAGAGVGSEFGTGTGNAWATAAGAVAGAAAGYLAEQEINNRDGVEYTLTLETGETLNIVQELKEGEPVFPNGARVMVQDYGKYQRVLAADHLPEAIKRPKGVKVID